VTAFDTNVLVRVLLGDDPVQTALAEAAFLEHAAADGVYVSRLVMAELAWVLGRGYRLDRSSIHERLTSLVRTRGVFVEQPEPTLEALRRFAAGPADLADYLILLSAAEDGAAPLLTFDRRLAPDPGASLLTTASDD